jgi:hypothetical protein
MYSTRAALKVCTATKGGILKPSRLVTTSRAASWSQPSQKLLLLIRLLSGQT